MNQIARSIDSVLERTSLLFQMARSHLLRLRGARIAEKVRLGRRVQVKRPWGLTLGKRVLIENDVFLKLVSDNANLNIGEYTFIGQGCVVDVEGFVSVGSHSLIAPGCFITDHHHKISERLRIDQQSCRTAPVHIGNDVWIGANSVILAGVTISDGAVVGAGAVVTRDVAEMDIVAGVPALQIGSRHGR